MGCSPRGFPAFLTHEKPGIYTRIFYFIGLPFVDVMDFLRFFPPRKNGDIKTGKMSHLRIE
jgi:hypothetical protein